MRTPISGFTPGLMSRTTLETLFVARESVLETVMRAIEAAAAGQGLNQTLIVAPRGAGKSHMLALAHHRTRDLIESGARIQVAWLPEDPWRITNYSGFLTAVLSQLATDQPRPGQPIGSSNSGPVLASPDELEGLVLGRVREAGPIVVLVENLDQILIRLGELGQQRLRHLLQVSQALLLVASSTRLDRNLSDQSRPFYGFFTTIGLPPFDDEQARALLIAIGKLQGDSLAAHRYEDPQMLARIKAVGRLTGGQPRTWIRLADAMALDNRASLGEQLIVRLDDLSPYYQERLARLSAQQRQIVVELASADHALHVADLAARIGAEQRSIGRSITDLVDLGWIAGVNSRFNNWSDRRRTYYELVDPLVKVAFQLKEFRGSMLSAIAEALSIWFEPAQGSESGSRTDERRTVADGVDQGVPDEPVDNPSAQLVLKYLTGIDLALCALAREDASEFLLLPSAVRMAVEESFTDFNHLPAEIERLRVELHLKVFTRLGFISGMEPQEWLARAEDEVAANPISVGWRGVLIRWLVGAGRLREAELVLNTLPSDVLPLKLPQWCRAVGL